MGYLQVCIIMNKHSFEFYNTHISRRKSCSDFDTSMAGDIAGKASPEVLNQLGEKLAEVSDICFFILAASTIVEVMDAHQGFRVITQVSILNLLQSNDTIKLN